MTVRIIHADVLEGLSGLPSDSVHVCVTSPPYYGLRDYGTGTWEGGDAGCDHRKVTDPLAGERKSGLQGGKKSNGHQQEGFRETCGHCGARRVDVQLGLEPTLAEHIDRLVEVFEEVRRVLRPDGVCFLNYGDSYATRHFTRQGKPRNVTQAPNDWAGTDLRRRRADHVRVVQQTPEPSLKPKDNCLIPERLSIALQEAGWWVRDRIIWHKPNPMPSSVTDRCTPSYELVYMLTKRGWYWWDAEAIREPSITGDIRQPYGSEGAWQMDGRPAEQRNGGKSRDTDGASRNARNVWTIATAPFPESHFATFAPELVRRALAAACPERVCASCGAGWVREVERAQVGDWGNSEKVASRTGNSGGPHTWMPGYHLPKTLGWSPSCTCNAGTRPGVALDPFGGSGTVGLVADRMNRDAILIEISADYCDMARRRIEGDAPLFSEVNLTDCGKDAKPLT